MFNFEFPKIDFINTLESFESKINQTLKDITDLKKTCEELEEFKKGGIGYIKLTSNTEKEEKIIFKLSDALTNFESIYYNLFDVNKKIEILSENENKYSKAIIIKDTYNLYQSIKERYFEYFLKQIESLNYKLCVICECKEIQDKLIIEVNLFNDQFGQLQEIFYLEDPKNFKKQELREKSKEGLTNILKPIIQEFKKIDTELKPKDILIISENELLDKLIKTEDIF